MRKLSSAVRGAVAVAAFAAAAVAYAQPCGGMGPGHGPGLGMGPGMSMGPGQGMAMGRTYGMGGGYGPAWDVDRAAVVEDRLAYVKAALKLTPGQEPQWQAYGAAWKAHAASMQATRDKMREQSGSAPDRMALRAEAMQQHAAEMAAMSKPLGNLYAVLTPEQKAVADDYLGMGGRHAARYPRRAG